LTPAQGIAAPESTEVRNSRVSRAEESNGFPAPVRVPAPLPGEQIDWLGNLPYLGMHLACFTVFFVGVSPIAVGVAALLFFLRMFAVTGFYHRYFSHKTFKTSRVFQFAMAVAGVSCVQRGPLWWAAHHRHHHAYSDEVEDLHSPRWLGFWRAHAGWFLTPSGALTATQYVRDWSRFRELVWIDRFHGVVPLLLAGAIFGLGAWLEHAAPSLGTNGWQMLVWGFVISTVVLYHATYTINSLSHTYGSQRFDTGDDSRNNLWLAFLTLGEGWHNNHHHYPNTVRQGFYWWEIDITYYLLCGLAKLRLIRDLRPVPAHILEKNRLHRA
jgi:stearoyl-CoA desaturase (delta-9 desaturase)